MMLASRTSRLGAQMLDSAITFGPLIVVALLSDLLPEVVMGVLALGAILFVPAYLLFADALPGGQSYGKRALGIAVVDKWSGAPCTAWQSFVRNLMLAILGLLDWVFIFGEKQQRLGDMVAETLVVDAATLGAGARYHERERARAEAAIDSLL